MAAVTIPEFLRPCRFLPLGAKSKKPVAGQRDHFENDEHNYAHDDPVLLAHIKNGGNYGVIPRNGVCIIDCDAPALWETIPGRWKLSYTVKTGRDGGGGKHIYLLCTDAPAAQKYLFGERGDIRLSGHRSYVVGPGSIHPDTGAEYRHVGGTRLVAVKWADVLKWIEKNGGRLAGEEKTPESSDMEAPQWANVHTGGQSIADRLGARASDFLMPENPHRRSTGEIEGAHPTHPDGKTGTNLTLSPDGEKWWCRRCNTGGGALEALAVAEGIVDCDDVRAGCLDGHWAEVFSALRQRGFNTDVLDTDTITEGEAIAAGLLSQPDTGVVGGDGISSIISPDSYVGLKKSPESNNTANNNISIISTIFSPSEDKSFENISEPLESQDYKYQNSDSENISDPLGKQDYKYQNSDVGETAPQKPTAPGHTPPVPFDEYPRPDFPIDTLPAWLRDFVLGLTVELQTPVDLAAMIALAACGGALAGRVLISTGGNWKEATNLYVAAVMGVSEKKSPTVGRIAAPIYNFEATLAESMKDEIRRALVKRSALEARISKKRRDIAKAPDEETDALTEELVILTAELDATPVPQPPRLLADDCTPEKLAGLIAANNDAMMFLSGEGGENFDMMAGRYSEGTANIGVYLKGYSREPLYVDRQTRAGDHSMTPTLTIALAIQHGVLGGLGLNRKFVERGLLARFCYVFPTSNVGYRDVGAPTMDVFVELAYVNGMNALLTTNAGGAPYVVNLSPEAAEVFLEHRRRLEVARRPTIDSDESELMQQWDGKSEGLTLRIAGILHCVAAAGVGDSWKNPVGVDTIRAAIRVVEYLAAHAKMAFGIMKADPALESAKYVWKRMCLDARPAMPHQDIWSKCKGRLGVVEALDAALGVLVARGFLIPMEAKSEGRRGRPPKPVYIKNPAAPLLSGGAV